MKKLVRSVGILVLMGTLMTPVNLTGQDPVAPGALEAYEVGQALPPFEEGQSLVEMSLDAAIDRALRANLDIQTVMLSPQIQSYSLQAAQAAFNPTFSGNYGYNNSTNQSTSQLDGGARTTSQRHTFNSSLSQTVPWYGGRLSADFNNSRTSTNNSFTTLNPSYRSTVSFNYTQPLLSGFRTDNQRNAVRTQQIQGQITDIQVSAQIANITDRVRVFYWGLRAAIEQIEIQRRSLAQAQQLLADNQLRVQLGTMAEIQVVQAESQVASAEQALLNAEVLWRNQELAFKLLLIGGADDPLLGQTVNPVDVPVALQQAVDIQAAIEIALRERTDIRQQLQQRRISELDLEVTENSRLPEFNLTASYSLLGVGGTEFDRPTLGGDPVLVQQGGYFDGLSSIADFETPTWNVGVNFSYPLGTSSQKANLQRARLQLQQTELAIKAQELQIVTEVTGAGLAVNDTNLQFQAAQRSRELAEESATAETTRFNAGVSTNFEVAAAQDDLTSARLSELRALINHVNAIAEFELVQRFGG
jgi:outer membrane protein TolC